MKEYGEIMEGSPQEVRYSLKSFEEDPIDHGYITRHRDEDDPLPIGRTAENDHFFMWNSGTERFELNYTGSAEIVNLLDVHLQVDARLREDGKPPRLISLYDTSGRFYESVVVHDVAVIKGGRSGPKHVAVFRPAADNERPFPLLIDDIYCLGLPKSYHEGSLMTDYVSSDEPGEEDS
jgi:hypothetical protein